MIERTQAFASALLAAGPHPSLGHNADVYGWLIGDWTGEFRDQGKGGHAETGAMEVHFAWVLQGYAVQDVWIAPTRAQRATAPKDGERDTWGSTLRVYDPQIDAWRVTWLNPVRNVRSELIGRRVGDEIVQLGQIDGRPAKWVFAEVTDHSFVWRAHELDDDGVHWRLSTDFRLSRTG